MLHEDQWMEPVSMTKARPEEERFCEDCGADLPYHDKKCTLLKNASKANPLRKCTWCPEYHIMGDEMYEHVINNHQDKLEDVKRRNS